MVSLRPEIGEMRPETNHALERLRASDERDITIEDDFIAIEEGLRNSVTPEQLASDQKALQALQNIVKNPIAQELLFHSQALRVNHEPENYRPVVQLPTLQIYYFKLHEAGTADGRVSHRFFVGEVRDRADLYLKRIPELATISNLRRDRFPRETDIGYDAEYLDLNAEFEKWQRDPSNIFVPKHRTVEISRQTQPRSGRLTRTRERLSAIIFGYR